MKGEDHRPVCREEFIEILILQAMRMLGLRLQRRTAQGTASRRSGKPETNAMTTKSRN